MAGSKPNILSEIEDGFQQVGDTPEKYNLTVLMIHDITGIKKKEVRKMLDAGMKVTEAYKVKHDFEHNKKPKHRFNVESHN